MRASFLFYPVIAALIVAPLRAAPVVDLHGDVAGSAEVSSPPGAELGAAGRARAGQDLSSRAVGSSLPHLLAGTVGLDDRHGFDASVVLASGADLTDFRSTITALGLTIVPLSSFLAADLAGLDAVIVNQPYTQNISGFSPAEIADLQAFVAAGGGLMIEAEGGSGADAYVAQMNTLAAPWGIVFAGFPSQGAGWTISALVPHTLTAGVTSFGVDYQRTLISISPPTIDLTVNSGADDALAVSDRLGACVVAISDESMWNNAGAGSDRPITFGDNRILLQNIVTFLVQGCQSTTCGNGIIESGEACDDANTDPTDLCAVDCTPTLCGDGVVQAPNGQGSGGPLGNGEESCDDANIDPADLCTSDCILTSCGDGIVQAPNGSGSGGPLGDGVEHCDDGNPIPDDGCTDCAIDQCRALGIVPIAFLRCVKSSDQMSVILTYSPDPSASGYNTWVVDQKTLIPSARQGGSGFNPPGCGPSLNSSCWHTNAVPPTSGTLLFYQVRGTCGLSEASE